MAELFGPVTPFVLMAVITGVTEYVKKYWQLDGRAVQLVALVVAFALIVPYHLLTGGLTALSVYSAVVYAALGWLTSIGLYEVARRHL